MSSASASLEAVSASAQDGRTAFLRYRTEQLAKLYDALSSSRESIISALTVSTGRAPVESQLELAVVLKYVKEQFLASEYKQVSAKTLLERRLGKITRPQGLVVVIGDKQTPLVSVILPLASAIAAGNAVVSYLADLSHLNVVLLSIFRALDPLAYAFFKLASDSLESVVPYHPASVFTSGDLSDSQISLLAQKSISIIRATAPGATVIVDREHTSAQLKDIAQLIVRGKFFGLGALPGSIEQVLVETSRSGELVDLVREETLRAFGSNVSLSSDYGRLAGKEGGRLAELVSRETKSGAKLVTGGNEKAAGLFEPTIIEDASSSLLRTKIAGPLLPIRKFVSLEGCLTLYDLKPTSTVYLFASAPNGPFLESELTAQEIYVNDVPLEALVCPSPAAYSSDKFSKITHINRSLISPTPSGLFAPFTSSKLAALAALFPKEQKLRLVRPKHNIVILRSFFPQGLLLVVGSVAAVLFSGIGYGGFKAISWGIHRFF